jgi:hypothetical protein
MSCRNEMRRCSLPGVFIRMMSHLDAESASLTPHQGENEVETPACRLLAVVVDKDLMEDLLGNQSPGKQRSQQGWVKDDEHIETNEKDGNNKPTIT